MRGKTYLDYFGGDTAEGRKQYRQFVYNGLGDDLLPDSRQGLPFIKDVYNT